MLPPLLVGVHPVAYLVGPPTDEHGAGGRRDLRQPGRVRRHEVEDPVHRVTGTGDEAVKRHRPVHDHLAAHLATAQPSNLIATASSPSSVAGLSPQSAVMTLRAPGSHRPGSAALGWSWVSLMREERGSGPSTPQACSRLPRHRARRCPGGTCRCLTSASARRRGGSQRPPPACAAARSRTLRAARSRPGAQRPCSRAGRRRRPPARRRSPFTMPRQVSRVSPRAKHDATRAIRSSSCQRPNACRHWWRACRHWWPVKSPRSPGYCCWVLVVRAPPPLDRAWRMRNDAPQITNYNCRISDIPLPQADLRSR